RLKISGAPAGPRERPARRGSPAPRPSNYSDLAVEELRRFRRELAQDLGIPAYIIFNDATMLGLAASLPTNRREFLAVKGTGDARWERFGAKITQICVLARATGSG